MLNLPHPRWLTFRGMVISRYRRTQRHLRSTPPTSQNRDRLIANHHRCRRLHDRMSCTAYLPMCTPSCHLTAPISRARYERRLDGFVMHFSVSSQDVPARALRDTTILPRPPSDWFSLHQFHEETGVSGCPCIHRPSFLER